MRDLTLFITYFKLIVWLLKIQAVFSVFFYAVILTSFRSCTYGAYWDPVEIDDVIRC